MNASAKVEGLVTAYVIFQLCVQIVLDAQQSIFISGDLGAKHKLFAFFQCLCDLLAPRNFTDPDSSCTVDHYHNVARKKGRMCSAQIQKHTVSTSNRIDIHFFN